MRKMSNLESFNVQVYDVWDRDRYKGKTYLWCRNLDVGVNDPDRVINAAVFKWTVGVERWDELHMLFKVGKILKLTGERAPVAPKESNSKHYAKWLLRLTDCEEIYNDNEKHID